MAEYGSASATEDYTPKADTAALFKTLKAWFAKDIEHATAWRKEAREDFAFYAGDQWSADDKKALKDKNRVPVVFNQTAPLVNAVVGSEINNRREVQYIPREQGDAQANEILTAAGEWFRDQTGAEDEESDAFQDTTIGGMGWSDTRLDFIEEPDGAPKIERIDPFEMVWDCYATKPNLMDATRLWRVREMPYAEAQEMFPDQPREMLHAVWAKVLDASKKEPASQDEADLYEGDDDDGYDRGNQLCTLVECRWIVKENYYRGPDIANPSQIKEYTEKQGELTKRLYPQFPMVRQQRKVVKRCFIGRDILAPPDKPQVPPGLFGWECITGYRDKITGQFYGIVRVAKDPQRWTNKFFSQVMYLLNSQSKGGVAAERGAFENDQEAEKSWAKADEITWMSPGSLSGDKAKIQPKPTAQFPAGFFTLFQEAKDEINKVTGLSPEFVGNREVDQAGVLEMQRRQSSLNLLASLFNSLRRYRKRQGRTMLYLIQNFLSDGRLIRIVGDERKEYVPLTKENVASQQYDIIVDDAPTSPNEKERIWGIIQQMFPVLKGMMTPDIMLEALSYSPLPASMIDKLKKKAQESAAQPKPPTPEEMKIQLLQAKGQQDAQAQQADLEHKQASNAIDLKAQQDAAAMKHQSDGIDLYMKQQDAILEEHIAEMRLANERDKIAIQAEGARRKANAKQVSAAQG